jgi:hypothetical protein
MSTLWYGIADPVLSTPKQASHALACFEVVGVRVGHVVALLKLRQSQDKLRWSFGHSILLGYACMLVCLSYAHTSIQAYNPIMHTKTRELRA